MPETRLYVVKRVLHLPENFGKMNQADAVKFIDTVVSASDEGTLVGTLVPGQKYRLSLVRPDIYSPLGEYTDWYLNKDSESIDKLFENFLEELGNKDAEKIRTIDILPKRRDYFGTMNRRCLFEESVMYTPATAAEVGLFYQKVVREILSKAPPKA